MPGHERIRTLLRPEGYVHRRDLIERGWRPDAIRRAVAEEGLIRAGRQWILAPEIDSALHAAASSGGVVTCASAASSGGLWLLERPAEHHLAFPPQRSGAPSEARGHWAAPVVPRPERSLTDPVENVLQLVADCLPYEQAQAVWDSALRTGRLTVDELNAVAWRGERARICAERATARSHSGLETMFCVRMRRLGVNVRQQVRIAGHRVDGLVGRRIVVQIDGYAHHSDVRQRRSDIAHDRALQRLGYVVLRFDYHEVVHDWPQVEAAVLHALAREAQRTR